MSDKLRRTDIDVVSTGWEQKVSRETLARLRRYMDELQRWSKRINLIGPSTADDIWNRHIADSWQLISLNPAARHWVDLGTGAGLPGMVIAAHVETLSESAVFPARADLVESNRKKTAFLRFVKPEIAPSAQIHDCRLEEAIPTIPRPDIVTARALAHLDQLLEWTEDWLNDGTVGLFPKGRGYRDEIAKAQSRWEFDCAIHSSVVDTESVILEITSLRRR